MLIKLDKSLKENPSPSTVVARLNSDLFKRSFYTNKEGALARPIELRVPILEFENRIIQLFELASANVPTGLN